MKNKPEVTEGERSGERWIRRMGLTDTDKHIYIR